MKEASGRSFKGQLYESTATRLQREMKDQERFSREGNKRMGKATRNTALSLGEWVLFLSFRGVGLIRGSVGK